MMRCVSDGASRATVGSHPPGIVAINTGNQALLQQRRLIAAFSSDQNDLNLLKRCILVAQGGTVAFRFVPEKWNDTVMIRVERIKEWGTKVMTMNSEPEDSRSWLRPLCCDDELGGNESTYPRQIQVHVPVNTSGTASISKTALSSGERNVVRSAFPQDHGTGYAIETFLNNYQTLKNGNIKGKSGEQTTLKLLMTGLNASNKNASNNEVPFSKQTSIKSKTSKT